MDTYLSRVDEDGNIPIWMGDGFWNFYEWTEELDGDRRKRVEGRREAAQSCLLVIALETFGDSEANGARVIDFFGDSRELKKNFDLLNTAKKVICIDTGHTNKAHAVGLSDGSPVPDVVETIKLFGKDIKVLHLNDNNSFTDQHLPPMKKMAGGVPWEDVYAALDEVGYNGVYNFELALAYYGAEMENFVRFLGGYLRKSVDGGL